MTGASPAAVGLWRRFTALYNALLSWLLVISVAILIIPIIASIHG